MESMLLMYGTFIDDEKVGDALIDGELKSMDKCGIPAVDDVLIVNV